MWFFRWIRVDLVILVGYCCTEAPSTSPKYSLSRISHSDTEHLSRSDEVLKLKNFKKDATLKLFKSTIKKSMSMSVQKSQVYKMAKRDYAWLMISRCSRSHSRQAKEQAQDLKSMITTSNHKLIIEVKDYELKTKNYENFTASSQEGLDKTYDRFQKLISQLEIHGEVISQEDANLKLLRSLPSAWNNIALIMRNKSDLDTLSIDDLYNNLKVYESEIKSKSSSSSNSQNVAFVSYDNYSSTNETVNTAHSVSTANFKDQASTASYVDDVMFSFFSNLSNAPQLDCEDLEQIDANDFKEMDLKWQVAMLTMRVKRFIKKTGRKMDLNDKETVGFDTKKIECYNCHRIGHFARECRALRNQGNRNRDTPRRNAPMDTSTTNALVVQDGIGGYDWSF
ncbi:ribonuclease H-like domain-containing protein [Tanacetum coccineum]